MPLQIGRSVLLVVCLATLGGCSGGGGGGGGGTPQGTITITDRTLTFEALGLSATTPPPQTVTATVTGVSPPETLYIVIKVTGPAVSSVGNITVTGTTTGQATVYPQGQSALGVGTFSSTLTVVACTTDPQCSSTQLNGSPITINVTYKIDGIASSPASLAYAIGNSPVSTDYTGSFNLSGNQSWTAASDTAWLTVTPASGSASTTPTAVTATLDPTQINALDSGTYTANVTLTPQQGNTVTLPVTVNIARTQVNYASPYAQISGSAGSAIIRGEHFDLAPPTGVLFGTTAATTFTLVSPTEIDATYPPLAAGSYLIHVPNAQGIDRTRAQLTIFDAPSYPAVSLDYPGTNPQGVGVSNIFYDAGRGALLVYAYSPYPSPEILRYSYSSATGWSASPLVATFPGAGAMCFSADGAKIFVGFQDPTVPSSLDLGVWEIDPVTLAVLKTTTETLSPVLAAPESISVANDGLTILSFAQNAPMTYSELRPGFNPLVPNGQEIGGLTASSLDGSVVALTGGGPQQDIGALWNASSEQLTTMTFSQSGQPGLNRNGTNLVIGAAVYGAQFTLAGSLPATTAASILSPTSAKAYTWDTNGTTGTVRTFDISAAPVGGQFPEIGTGVTPPGTYLGAYVVMAISPDGGTLFLAGTNHIAVMPAP
jgi:hypothetical protein